jgi:hypothetical protein
MLALKARERAAVALTSIEADESAPDFAIRFNFLSSGDALSEDAKASADSASFLASAAALDASVGHVGIVTLR